MADPFGYQVLILEHGQWNTSWDGEIHATLAETEAGAAEARKRGYTAKAVALADVDPDTSAGPLDTIAVNTIALVLNENEQWSSDEIELVAEVVTRVRGKSGPNWNVTGPTFLWRGGSCTMETAV